MGNLAAPSNDTGYYNTSKKKEENNYGWKSVVLGYCSSMLLYLLPLFCGKLPLHVSYTLGIAFFLFVFKLECSNHQTA